MDPTIIFSDILAMITNHNIFVAYFMIFLLLCLEGPIITYIAGIIASFGYLNIWIIWVLCFLGGQIPDSILYFAGRFFRKKSAERFIEKVGLNEKRVKWLEKNLNNHAIKTIALVKLTGLAIPGLFLSGFTKIHFKKYFITCFVMNLIFGALFTFSGFYSGIAITTILKYFKLTEYFLLPAVILVIIAYFLVKKLYKWLSKLWKEEI